MKQSLSVCLCLAVLAGASARAATSTQVTPFAQVVPALQLERVVLLMRHGIRPPTHEPALDPAIAPQAWPSWPAPDGYLTPHGAAAIRLLAVFDRGYFAALAPAGACPAMTIYADVDERTVKTGEAYAAGFAPGCAVAVGHAAANHDELFSGLDTPGAGFDAAQARAEMLAAAGGDVAAPVKAHAALFNQMQAVLAPGQTAFLQLPAGVQAKNPAKAPRLSGPIAEGASASEDFLLEYLEGKKLSEVGWGRVGPADVATLLALHPLAYTITARPDYIADRGAAALARRIVDGLSGGVPITVLVGHDTNIAQLGGLLHLHWHLGGYPADDPPPGGGLIFAVLHDPARGTDYVTVRYQVQTMAQMRNLTPLTAAAPPALQALAIPGCGDSTAPTACTLRAFTMLVSATAR